MNVKLFDKSIYVDPHQLFKQWRESSPVVYDFDKNTYGITKYKDVEFAFKNPDIFTSSLGARANQIPQPFMIDADDPEHRIQRKIVERSFTPGQMSYFSRQIEEITLNLLSDACQKVNFDFVEKNLMSEQKRSTRHLLHRGDQKQRQQHTSYVKRHY